MFTGIKTKYELMKFIQLQSFVKFWSIKKGKSDHNTNHSLWENLQAKVIIVETI